MEVGVQFHCGVRLQLPKPALRLSVKKQDDVHSCAGDRRNHSGASASESPASCPPSETPGCAAEGGLTDEQHSAWRKEEQLQLAMVLPWGWRAESGVPSNAIRYRGGHAGIGADSCCPAAAPCHAVPRSQQPRPSP